MPGMPYVKLSEQVQALSKPLRSDAFIRLFREAVRVGAFDAADLPARFELPKQFRRRGKDDIYAKAVRDMVFEPTPAFETWFAETNAALTADRRGARAPKLSVEAIEAGLMDFKALAQETRRKLEASYIKGQAVGNSRKKTPAKKAVGPAKRK